MSKLNPTDFYIIPLHLNERYVNEEIVTSTLHTINYGDHPLMSGFCVIAIVM